jgi:hypothetical protein
LEKEKSKLLIEDLKRQLKYKDDEIMRISNNLENIKIKYKIIKENQNNINDNNQLVIEYNILKKQLDLKDAEIERLRTENEKFKKNINRK